MTQYLFDRDTVRILSDKDVTLGRELPAQNYTVKFNQMMGFYLSEVPNFIIPPKVYGDAYARAERILHTFSTRKNQTTGVLLSGDKGSGKTLLTRMICTMSGLPVVMIPQGLPMAPVLEELEKIQTPLVIMIDEMEKKFPSSSRGGGDDFEPAVAKAEGGGNRDSQAAFLSFLDGTNHGQKLVVMTTNSVYRINEFLLSRPGRVFYHYKYGSLSEAEIREYIADKIPDADKVEELVVGCMFLGRVSYDALQAIVEEVQRYNCSFKEAAMVMNLQSDFGSVYSSSRAEYFDKDGKLIPECAMDASLNTPPDLSRTSNGYYLSGYMCTKKKALDDKSDRDDFYVDEVIHPRMLFRREGLSFYYRLEDGYIVKLTAQERSVSHHWTDSI